MRGAGDRCAGEEGQAVVMAAIVLVLVLGFAGLAVDVGLFLHTRTTLQRTVDAMALAGAQDLCGLSACESDAAASANTYGNLNGVLGSDTLSIQFGVDCDGGTSSAHDMITVRLLRHRETVISRVVGVLGGDVGACATARKFALGALSGVRPFGLEESCIANIGYGNQVILKFDSDTTRSCDANQGNYGALAIDGSGASVYRDTIKYGSNGVICAQGVSGCTNYVFSTETGDMIGPTKQGVDYLMDNAPAGCDSWGEVTTADEKLSPQCNPWRPGYSGVSRLIVVPVVNGMWASGGSNSIIVKRFALVYLEGFDGQCTGNSCDIKARFIKSSIEPPGAQQMALTPEAETTVAKLVK
jgi:hypothetical protein